MTGCRPDSDFLFLSSLSDIQWSFLEPVLLTTYHSSFDETSHIGSGPRRSKTRTTCTAGRDCLGLRSRYRWTKSARLKHCTRTCEVSREVYQADPGTEICSIARIILIHPAGKTSRQRSGERYALCSAGTESKALHRSSFSMETESPKKEYYENSNATDVRRNAPASKVSCLIATEPETG